MSKNGSPHKDEASAGKLKVGLDAMYNSYDFEKVSARQKHGHIYNLRGTMR